MIWLPWVNRSELEIFFLFFQSWRPRVGCLQLLQTGKPLLASLFSPSLWLFLGAPGDTVLLSSLTDWHGQNESSSLLPKARLCPRGALAGRISITPAVLECTDCDGPWAPLAPHRLSRIMHPPLHRQAWSMSWTAQADSCRRDASACCD